MKTGQNDSSKRRVHLEWFRGFSHVNHYTVFFVHFFNEEARKGLCNSLHDLKTSTELFLVSSLNSVEKT